MFRNEIAIAPPSRTGESRSTVRAWAAVLMLCALVLFPAGGAQAYDLSFAASNSGGALTPWSGTVTGEKQVVSYSEGPGASRTWVSDAQTVVVPPIPEENWITGPVTGRQAMYQLIQFLVDLLLSSYYPSDPTAIGAATGYNFTQAATAVNATYGIFVDAGGSSTASPVPGFEGVIAASVETPFSYCRNMYAVSGEITPNGPGAALLTGTAVLPLQDGTDLVIDIQGSYAFDPTLELPAATHYQLDGSFALVDGEPQTWAIHSTYTETPVGSVPVARTTWGRVKSLYR